MVGRAVRILGLSPQPLALLSAVGWMTGGGEQVNLRGGIGGRQRGPVLTGPLSSVPQGGQFLLPVGPLSLLKHDSRHPRGKSCCAWLPWEVHPGRGAQPSGMCLLPLSPTRIPSASLQPWSRMTGKRDPGTGSGHSLPTDSQEASSKSLDFSFLTCKGNRSQHSFLVHMGIAWYCTQALNRSLWVASGPLTCTVWLAQCFKKFEIIANNEKFGDFTFKGRFCLLLKSGKLCQPWVPNPTTPTAEMDGICPVQGGPHLRGWRSSSSHTGHWRYLSESTGFGAPRPRINVLTSLKLSVLVSRMELLIAPPPGSHIRIPCRAFGPLPVCLLLSAPLSLL